MKRILLVLAVVAAPVSAVAQAEGCHHGREQQAQTSCAERQVWDNNARRCVVRDS